MNIKTIFSKALSIFDQKEVSTRGVGGSIAKIDNQTTFGSYFTPIIARAGLTKTYAQFTQEVIRTLPDNQVRNLIKRGSPIVAKAMADYADAIASGYTYTADITAPEGTESPAQALLDNFFLLLEQEQGGIEGLIGEMARGMFAHGAAFTELVIAEDLMTPAQLKVLDPTTAQFRKNKDELIGEYYELGQDIGFDGAYRNLDRQPSVGSLNFVSFHNDPTIQYRAIQKEANNPYGTPLLDPAVFHVIMMAGFFSSFQDALTGHVWPNKLITIDKEKFRANAGTSLNPKQLEEKLNAAVKDIVENVGKLKPGQAIVQGDEVAITGSLTGENRSPLGSVKDIQDVIRRELVVGVQSQPVLMASNEAIAETHAIEQIKAYGKLVRRGQRVVNALVTDYLNLILTLNGYPPFAQFKLSYVNTADYKDQSATYKQFREGLKAGSDDLQQFVLALDQAVASGYMTEQEAQEEFDEGMKVRRELNILPQDL